MSHYEKVTITSNGVKAEGAEIGELILSQPLATSMFQREVFNLLGREPVSEDWVRAPEMTAYHEGGFMVTGRVQRLRKGHPGWRARKGPQTTNQSGFRATGHRLLLLPDPLETTTAGGLILSAKTVAQDESKCVWATVVEIGCDAWSDKGTDYCDVGDRVLIGEFTGKFHVSPRDGVKYRFVNDLDIITPLVSE